MMYGIKHVIECGRQYMGLSVVFNGLSLDRNTLSSLLHPSGLYNVCIFLLVCIPFVCC